MTKNKYDKPGFDDGNCCPRAVFNAYIVAGYKLPEGINSYKDIRRRLVEIWREKLTTRNEIFEKFKSLINEKNSTLKGEQLIFENGTIMKIIGGNNFHLKDTDIKNIFGKKITNSDILALQKAIEFDVGIMMSMNDYNEHVEKNNPDYKVTSNEEYIEVMSQDGTWMSEAELSTIINENILPDLKVNIYKGSTFNKPFYSLGNSQGRHEIDLHYTGAHYSIVTDKTVPEIEAAIEAQKQQALHNKSINKKTQLHKLFDDFFENKYMEIAKINQQIDAEVMNNKIFFTNSMQNLANSEQVLLHAKNKMKKAQTLVNRTSRLFVDYCRANKYDLRADDMSDIETMIKQSPNMQIQKLTKIIGKMNDFVKDLKDKQKTYREYEKLVNSMNDTLLIEATNFRDNVNNLITELKTSKPKINSRQHKQLEYLKGVKPTLNNFVNGLKYESKENIKVFNPEDFTRKVKVLQIISDDIRQKFDEIGYPSKFKQYMNKLKNGLVNLFMFIPKVKQLKSILITKGKMSQLFNFSNKKNSLSSLHKLSKEALQLKNSVVKQRYKF